LKSLGSSVSIVTRLRAERPGFDSRQGQGLFFFATASRPVLRSAKPPMQWLPGTLSLGLGVRGVKLTIASI
jgi:hypothetical protein